MQNYEGRHPSTVHMMKMLQASPNLPPNLRVVALSFQSMAEELVSLQKDGPELTAGLSKLLEAKGCFVRNALDSEPVSYMDR